MKVYLILWDHCGCDDLLLYGSRQHGDEEYQPAIFARRKDAEAFLADCVFGDMDGERIVEAEIC